MGLTVASAVVVFPKPHPWSAAVGRDELDACGFERLTYDRKRCRSWNTVLALELTYRHHTDGCCLREIGLSPGKQAASSAALSG